MEGRINPENWKDIFSDTLYIIADPNAVPVTPVTAAQTPAAETAKAASAEAPKPTPAATVTPAIPSIPAIPKTPSIPVAQPVQATAQPAQVMEHPVMKAQEAAVTLKPSGAYSNGILLLMHASYTMTAAQQEMLGKIVKAAQLDYNSCGILQVNTPVALKDIEALKPRIILSFGLPTDAFTPQLPKELYTIQKHNSTIILLADSLAKLETTVALKGQLWNAMKEMFGIK